MTAPRPWRTVLAADLHLTPADGPGIARMEQLLATVREQARRLILLGDVFDLWVSGAELRLAAFEGIFAAFRAARAAGVELTFLAGNRDFNFTAADGAALGIDVAAGEELDAELAGEPARLLHGDQLLTDDRGYQALKAVVRSAPARFAARRFPPALVLAVARRLRRHSDRAVPRKPSGRLRIVPAEVERRLAAGARRVVCGHVHRLERRRYGGGELLVLPPFCAGGQFVVDLGGAAEGAEAGLRLGAVGSGLRELPPAVDGGEPVASRATGP